MRFWHSLLAIILIAPHVSFAAQLSGMVTRILDGDTIEVKSSHNSIERVRLKNIDAPEKKQDFGLWSKKQLERALNGKNVVVRYSAKDRYGRIIGSISTNQIEDVNKYMVENGAAWVYKQYNNDPSLNKIELTAKKKRLGIWSRDNPIPPWDWRRMN